MRLECVHCSYTWDYKGNHNFWATCPQCRYKVRIIQKPMRKLEENWEPNVEETNDKRVVDVVWKLLHKYNHDKISITQVLVEIQETYGWLPQEMISEVCKQLELPYGQVYQIVTFLRAENVSEALKSSTN